MVIGVHICGVALILYDADDDIPCVHLKAGNVKSPMTATFGPIRLPLVAQPSVPALVDFTEATLKIVSNQLSHR
jgi:hypothetical protein